MGNAGTAGNVDDNVDLAQFHEIFFEEAGEHLDRMEALLVDIDLAAPGAETLNAIFRAAHSIKGGAATFGFRDITELTHEMETVFDLVRNGEMALGSEIVDLFLASGDMLKNMLAERRAGGSGVSGAPVQDLCARLRALLAPGAVRPLRGAAAEVAAAAQAAAPGAAREKRIQVLEIVFGPFDERITPKMIDGVIEDLAGFGELQNLPSQDASVADAGAAPARAKSARTKSGRARARGAKRGAKPALHVVEQPAERRVRLTTDVGVQDMIDTLGFMVAPDRVRVTPVEGEPTAALDAPGEDFGLFEENAAQTETPSAASAETTSPAEPPAAPKVVELKAPGKIAPAADAASIRVSVQKVDYLINLVGELVITQSMLAQTAAQADPVMYESLANGIAQLERNTRDLQEASMSIRMMPMSVVFSRFPRLVRDLAGKLGKEIELRTEGDDAELDKGLTEHIVDPLTHLVRNSLDHGIEMPEERLAQGKIRKGTITLRAYHKGGNIVIEVADDGKGLDRERILAKAKERGMAVSAEMSDQEVWQLIFEPGFSTAAVVTDVSGRGVGMDVVKRNIAELGGRVEIDSVIGAGTRITIRLPLTLAILDGMSVRVGSEIFIIPLGYVVESLQPEVGAIHSVQNAGQVIAVRGDFLPMLALHGVFNMKHDAQSWEQGIVVIIEAEGTKTALFVDDLVGQHQVVIKSIETNYRKVPGISGATIMGDGRVALILDVGHLVARAGSRIARAA
ncbi:MAG: chemotaxis protein CheW [Betaproteobacteria bacterium]|nr:chemotaxis protein CheW [Betaproteobacteria bacterium]